jgi:signal transduction histidine kinase
MKIKTRLMLINALLLLVTIAIGSVLLATSRRVPTKLEHSEEIHHIARELFTLETAVKEYRFLRLPRASRQWRTSSQRLGSYLEAMDDDYVDPTMTVAMVEAHEEIDALLATLPARPLLVPSRVEQRVIEHVQIKIQDMLLWSQMLAVSLHIQLEDAHRRSNMFVLVFAAGVVLVMLGMQAFFRRTILQPLGTLEKGARRVGHGDFEHPLPRHADDEIGHLTGVFNEMRDNLRGLTRAREEFMSAAIHEIKTPVAVIKTSVQFLQQFPPEQREKRLPQMLARLDRQCNRLDRLVTDVLELTRLDMRKTELRRRPTDVVELVGRVVAEMENVSPRHRLVAGRMDAIEAEIDPDRIEQVVFNLIDNAIKYSPFGGDVDVSVCREEETFVISVRDRGIGIATDKQERVFERFYRAHAGTRYEHAASLGVGLYLSREIAARHGGSMWFESEEGEGAMFHLRLPIVPKSTENGS